MKCRQKYFDDLTTCRQNFDVKKRYDRLRFPGSPRGGSQHPGQERLHRADVGGLQRPRGHREAPPTGGFLLNDFLSRFKKKTSEFQIVNSVQLKSKGIHDGK